MQHPDLQGRAIRFENPPYSISNLRLHQQRQKPSRHLSDAASRSGTRSYRDIDARSSGITFSAKSVSEDSICGALSVP
jgi:hypothetical protein